jgi:hypothetical protein
MTDESIRSLTRRVDPDRRIWQICAVCIEWIRFEDLVLDPADGLRGTYASAARLRPV